MSKNSLLFTPLYIFLLCICGQACVANACSKDGFYKNAVIHNTLTDTVPPVEVMDVITRVINSTNNFSIEDVASLYTPNAVISDDEPPYSWNGPTAGVQWVNAIEQACKDFKVTKLKAIIEPINVFQLNVDNIYIVVPVSYTGNLPHKGHFSARGAFTFVLRSINGKWLIKSQAWMPKKAI